MAVDCSIELPDCSCRQACSEGEARWSGLEVGELLNLYSLASTRSAGSASFMLLATSSGLGKAKEEGSKRKEQRTGKYTGFGNC